MTSIICLFELVHLNGLLFDEGVDHVVKELNIEKDLKSSIFVVQKAAAPKNGVEFRHGSNNTIKSSLAMSYDVWRRHVMSLAFNQSEAEKLSQINRQTEKNVNNNLEEVIYEEKHKTANRVYLIQLA